MAFLLPPPQSRGPTALAFRPFLGTVLQRLAVLATFPLDAKVRGVAAQGMAPGGPPVSGHTIQADPNYNPSPERGRRALGLGVPSPRPGIFLFCRQATGRWRPSIQSKLVTTCGTDHLTRMLSPGPSPRPQATASSGGVVKVSQEQNSALGKGTLVARGGSSKLPGTKCWGKECLPGFFQGGNCQGKFYVLKLLV